jgi:subtilisin family serine protease
MVQATALPKPIEYGWAQVPSNNKSGWAWWAGTSFATPILTAVIASVLSGPQTFNTIQDVRTALEGAKIIQKELTSQKEPGIPSSVKQKPNPNL